MHDTIRFHFAEIQTALGSTNLLETRIHAVSDLIEKLPPLYTKYRETNSSRFGDEITRIVQAVLRELDACPQAKKLEADFREKLHQLHEDLGIPRLALKAPPTPKSRKSPKS